MTISTADGKTFLSQNLSSMVRARLLFQREIEIDGQRQGILNNSFLERILEQKRQIDLQMTKLLGASFLTTLLLYLAGAGIDAKVPIWGITLLEVPGIFYFLSFISAFLLAMSTFTFFNSQTYNAVIDQLILEATERGVVDPEVLKAGYENSWLIFKVLRANFNIYAPVHIEMSKAGRRLNSFAFFLLTLVAISPFLALVIAQPYLSLTIVPNGIFGISTKGFSLLCAFATVYLVFITEIPFECKQELERENESE